MKREMYEIAVESRDGIISINSPVVIKWIQEAIEEATRGNGDADEK